MKVRLLVAYKGTDFHGFAEQSSGVPTVGALLRQALETVVREPVELACAGRTDTGVHAQGQVVSFKVANESLDLEQMMRSANRKLLPHVVIREAERMDAEFDARFSATSRSYCYRVLSSPTPDPLRSDLAWWVPDPLDLDAMNEAASAIIGSHDFGTFCRRPNPEAPLTRRVASAHWGKDAEDIVRFDIKANAFCHQMIRSIVGHMVEIGRGRRPAGDMKEALEAVDRARGATLAPPQGLVLWEVTY